MKKRRSWGQNGGFSCPILQIENWRLNQIKKCLRQNAPKNMPIFWSKEKRFWGYFKWGLSSCRVWARAVKVWKGNVNPSLLLRCSEFHTLNGFHQQRCTESIFRDENMNKNQKVRIESWKSHNNWIVAPICQTKLAPVSVPSICFVELLNPGKLHKHLSIRFCEDLSIFVLFLPAWSTQDHLPRSDIRGRCWSRC